MQWMVLVPFAVLYLVRVLFSGAGVGLMLAAAAFYFFSRNDEAKAILLQIWANLF